MATELRAVRDPGVDRFIASVGDNWTALQEAGMANGRESSAESMATSLRGIAAEHEPTHGRYWSRQGEGPDIHHVATRLAEHLSKEKPGQAVVIKEYAR